MKDRQTINLLFDFYGTLLTERQQALMQAYYAMDLSLAEIADGEHVSRQAVHDLIKRAEASLADYEQKLGFYQEYQQRQSRLTELETALQRQDLVAATAALVALKSE
jgi:predicted DNA-binding protein YlxM (UPF0122 family)